MQECSCVSKTGPKKQAAKKPNAAKKPKAAEVPTTAIGRHSWVVCGTIFRTLINYFVVSDLLKLAVVGLKHKTISISKSVFFLVLLQSHGTELYLTYHITTNACVHRMYV